MLKDSGLIEGYYEAYVFGHCADEFEIFRREWILVRIQAQGHSEVFGLAGFVEIEQRVGVLVRGREPGKVEDYSGEIVGAGKKLLYVRKIGVAEPYIRFEVVCRGER